MAGELERHAPYEQSAAVLYERYAGFVDANALTDSDKIIALASLVPMALQVVEEARDTIQRLNEELEAARQPAPSAPSGTPPPTAGPTGSM